MQWLYWVSLLFSGALPAESAATIVLRTEGLRVQSGYVQVSLYRDPSTFPDPARAFRLVRQEVKGSVVVMQLPDLPEGEYAIALMHDENGDRICNRNFLGIPVEGFGFSNNVVPRLSVPSFDQARFRVASRTEVVIRMIYL
jgi:uncharacterized protein (DUF2141 family)